MTRISVVIATRDRPGALATCLEALARSFPDGAETIVVSDGTRRPSGLDSLAEHLRLRVFHTGHAGPAAARNLGLAEAHGEVVAFTDDDCVPHADWLSTLTAAVSPGQAAGGTTLNGLPSNPYADASQLILDLIAEHQRAAYGARRFFPANNIAFPTQDLRDIGGFDESFRTAEDRDLCRRWLRAGHDLRHVPEAFVEHYPTLDLPGFVAKFYAYGRGAAQFHSSRNGSLRESAAFQRRLPALLAPVAARRGLVTGTQLVGLVGLWELASLAGYLRGGR